MLSTFVIALREGLEAALIVGILVAYLVKTDRRSHLKALWSGVAVAILLSLALGAFLTYTSAELSDNGEMVFAGTTAITAVGLVTWMVFWMKRTARGLRNELEGKAGKAVLAGPVALAIASFAAVSREGLETSLFLYTNFTTVGAFSAPSIGLVIGLVAAVLLGYALYKRTISLDLGKFFTYSGIALIIVAAGVLSHGVGEFLELGWIPGEGLHIWDFTAHLSEDSFVASLASGTIGLGPKMTWLQFIIWAGYLWATLTAYLKPARTPVAA